MRESVRGSHRSTTMGPERSSKEEDIRANKAETDSLLAQAQESMQKATAKLQSIQRQHQKQCEELIEEKSGLLVGLVI